MFALTKRRGPGYAARQALPGSMGRLSLSAARPATLQKQRPHHNPARPASLPPPSRAEGRARGWAGLPAPPRRASLKPAGERRGSGERRAGNAPPPRDLRRAGGGSAGQRFGAGGPRVAVRHGPDRAAAPRGRYGRCRRGPFERGGFPFLAPVWLSALTSAPKRCSGSQGCCPSRPAIGATSDERSASSLKPKVFERRFHAP